MRNLNSYLISQPYLCVATLVAIIVNNETSLKVRQEDIAEYFGVNVPMDYVGSIINSFKTNDVNKLGIVLSEEGLNPFFKSHNFLLVERYRPISLYTDWMFEDILMKAKKDNCYLICGYDYGMLYNGKPNGVGHVSIILDIEAAGRSKVSIYDPGPDNPGIKTIDTEDLYYAIHTKKNGLWIIESTK